MKVRISTVYGILGLGVAFAFLGHGILATKTKDTFVELVTGNYDNVLGGTMSVGTAENWVTFIGWLDIILAIAFFGLVFAALTGRKTIAYSPAALVLFGWAMVWGFLTALSRFTVGFEGITIWDVVERGPNYMAPAALVYIVYTNLRAKAPATEPKATPGSSIPTH